MISDSAASVAFTGHRTYDGSTVVGNSNAVGPDIDGSSLGAINTTQAPAFPSSAPARPGPDVPSGRRTPSSPFTQSGPVTADAALRTTITELYKLGARTFLSGMAVGFDLAAAEVVLACREMFPDLRLICVVPFAGQERRFSSTDRERYGRVLATADEVVVLSPVYHAGCYAVRNNYLTDHASTLVAWYDGSPGGTHYTVRRAQRRGLVVRNLAPGLKMPISGTLF